MTLYDYGNGEVLAKSLRESDCCVAIKALNDAPLITSLPEFPSFCWLRLERMEMVSSDFNGI